MMAEERVNRPRWLAPIASICAIACLATACAVYFIHLWYGGSFFGVWRVAFPLAALALSKLGSVRSSSKMLAGSLALAGISAICIAPAIMSIPAAKEEHIEAKAVAQYDDIIHTPPWQGIDLLRHFPDPIPVEAEHIRFYYCPPFLQGGAVFQLRMRLPAAQIEALYNRFAPFAIHIFEGGYTYNHMMAPYYLPTTHFSSTSDDDEDALPADYAVMVLYDEPGKAGADPQSNSWNHGRNFGVAISKERRDIIYWAEQW